MLVKLQTADYLIYAELDKEKQDPTADVLCDPARDRGTRGFSYHVGFGGRRVFDTVWISRRD